MDVFVSRAAPRTRAWLDFAGNLLLTLVFALIAWRLWGGTLDKRLFGESSYILALPVWWFYAASVLGAAAAVAVGAFSVLRSLAEALGPDEAAGR